MIDFNRHQFFGLGESFGIFHTGSGGLSVTIPFGTSLAEADRQLILATLEQCGGVKTRAAEILGISLKTLYNRLVEYGDEANKPGAEDDAASAAGGARS